MSYNLTDLFNNGAHSELFINPVKTHIDAIRSSISGITGLANLPGLGSSLDSVNSLATSAESYVAGALDSLKVKLPLMSAFDSLSKKMSIVSGVQPGSGPSELFTSSFAGLDTVKSAMETHSGLVSSTISSVASSLGGGGSPQEIISSFASTVPNLTIPDPSNPVATIPNPDYEAFAAVNADKLSAVSSGASSLSASVTNVQSTLTSAISSEAASISSAVGKISDLAFASFTARPQPAYVSELMAKYVKPPSVDTCVGLDITRTSNLASSIQASIPAPVRVVDVRSVTPLREVLQQPLPMVNTTQPTSYNSDALLGVLASNNSDLKAYNEGVLALEAQITPWQKTNNYAAVEGLAVDNPSNAEYQAMYVTLRDRLGSETPYLSWKGKVATHYSGVKLYNANLSLFADAVSGTSYVNIAAPVDLGDGLTLQKLSYRHT